MFIYKIKFSIFGKIISARIVEEDGVKACQKLIASIFKKLEIEDVEILNKDGSQVDTEEYIAQQVIIIERLLEKIKNGSKQIPFSEN